MPATAGKKQVQLSINVVKPKATPKARKTTKFPRPFAFVDVNYRLLAPAPGNEFLFAFDQFVNESAFAQTLKAAAPEAAVTRTIGNAFLVGYFLSFPRGFPKVYKDGTREAVNGILYEVTAGSAASLQTYLQPRDPRVIIKGEVNVPSKGTASNVAILNPAVSDPPADSKPLGSRLSQMTGPSQLNSNWKAMLSAI